MTTNGTLDPSIQGLLDYARGLHYNVEIKPTDLLTGGKYEVPAGFQVNIDAFAERVWIYGPSNDDGVLVKTLVQYGGEFKILGIDLLRGLTQVMSVGEPAGKRSQNDRQQYFLNLLATATPFLMPAKAPMTKAEMHRHVETCDACRPVNAAFIAAIDAGSNIASESHMRTMIEKAHANQEEAIKYYRGKVASQSRTPRAAAAQEA